MFERCAVEFCSSSPSDDPPEFPPCCLAQQAKTDAYRCGSSSQASCVEKASGSASCAEKAIIYGVPSRAQMKTMPELHPNEYTWRRSHHTWTKLHVPAAIIAQYCECQITQKIHLCQPAMENKNTTLLRKDKTINAFQSIDSGTVGRHRW